MCTFKASIVGLPNTDFATSVNLKGDAEIFSSSGVKNNAGSPWYIAGFFTSDTSVTCLINTENCVKSQHELPQMQDRCTKLQGIDAVAADVQKGTLTVVGDVDPVLITNQVRKIGKVVEIISGGRPKPDAPKPQPDNKSLPTCCNESQLVAVSFTP
ncbi:hypothetical protein HHK36_020985 [Tetracentron sinense]|uniref:HMA domain-containing protein n=1 Tax=Tetracentron sinense TaxID=13715 RepID=A0A834YWD1_TETSI|nr:hypothetical protein HHK36_020985 [Tetracentron sinense]